MKNTCVIKSNNKGITVLLDDSIPFEDLVIDVCKVFSKSRDFFGKKQMVLSIEGRDLNPDEVRIVVEAIELNSEITIPLIADNSEIRDVRTTGAIDRFYFEQFDTNAKIIRGNVKNNEVITSDTGILVAGDVKKGAKLIAKGNVTVLGTLEGTVRAGEPDYKDAFITAGKFLAKTATIGGVTGEVNIRYRGLKTAKIQREAVVVKNLNDVFYAEPLSSGLIMQDK